MKHREIVPAVLLVIVFFVCSRLSPYFLDFHYLLSSSTVYMEVGLLAIGTTLVIVCHEIDLSIGSNMVLTGCLTAKLLAQGWPIWAGVLAACAIGAVLGALNGALVAKLRLPSFLVTLGTMAMYRGAAQAMLGPHSVKLPASFVGLDMASILGVPWPLVIFLFLSIATGLVLHRTVFGRWVFAVGTNESAARYSSVPVDRVKIAVFALQGLLCGMAALLIDSRLGVARFDFANGIELDAITVAVVGGADIMGGVGSMLGTVIAMFLIELLKTGMGVADVKAEYQLTAIGTLLILAVLSVNLTHWAGSRFPLRSAHPDP